MDPKGSTWVRISDEPVRFATHEEELEHFATLNETTQVAAAEDEQSSEPAVRALSEMDITEVAELLRGTTLRYGYEYRQEPDLERAALLQAGLFDNASFPPSPETSPASDDWPSDDDLIGQHHIFSPDNRAIHRNNTTYPYSTAVLLSSPAGDTSCSATMIGPSTAITGAHCLKTSSGQWLNVRAWAPAVDRQDGFIYSAPNPPANPDPTYSGAAFPFSNTPASNDPYPHIDGKLLRGCYTAYAPAYNNTVQTDWAILEFDRDWIDPYWCNEYFDPTFIDKPGNYTGWLGIAAPSKATTEGLPLSTRGYPTNSPSCAGGDCFHPSVWGQSGVYPKEVNDHAIEYELDMNHGQSGSGVYGTDSSSNRYVLAVHRGSHQTCAGVCWNWRNYGRRITPDVLAAIQYWSEL